MSLWPPADHPFDHPPSECEPPSVFRLFRVKKQKESSARSSLRAYGAPLVCLASSSAGFAVLFRDSLFAMDTLGYAMLGVGAVSAVAAARRKPPAAKQVVLPNQAELIRPNAQQKRDLRRRRRQTQAARR